MTANALVNPFAYADPQGSDEHLTFGNANGYEWSYLDTCRENGIDPRPFPDGWARAWLEYNRRDGVHRMAIREAFRTWRETRTLPGLS